MNVTFYPDRVSKTAPCWAVTPATLARIAVDWINCNHTNPRTKWANYRACIRCAKGGAK